MPCLRIFHTVFTYSSASVPVLEQLAGAGKSLTDFSVDVTGGALKGVTGMAGGLVSGQALRTAPFA